MHHHPDLDRCAICDQWPDWAVYLTIQLTALEELMTSYASDQAHIDADVTAVTQALTQIQQEIAVLKSQVAANPQAPVSTLDLSRFDALVAVAQGDSTADLPPAPSANAPTLQGSPLAQSVGSVPSTAGSVPTDPNPVETAVVPDQPTASDLVPSVPPAGAVAGGDVSVGSAGAPESTPASTSTTSASATSAPATTLYRHVGTDTIDSSVWPDSGLKNAEGDELYTFSGDTTAGDENGASAEWVVDTAAPASGSSSTSSS